ncbi:MAG: hypothetical protein JSV92_03240 [archaeon]|nr:MAG: hypothetical protein JSV92_03240 [archaeon]
MDNGFLKQLGIGVASLTFGVALSIFILAIYAGLVSGIQAWLLYLTTFLLMLRFWWRYTELFVQNMPSRGYWHFLFDFAISFFGIAAVLFVSNIRTWALMGAAAMLASMIRCGMSWKSAKKKEVKKELKNTVYGSFGMLVIFSLVYLLAPFFDNLWLAGTVFILVLLFVIYASRK